ncbi:hypothetical protein PGTUg99_024029 [Puccinia graminis f. sp. tritici]|nr:hypothetical protein PGTUg99_024029 [Puccinia graminis f. sp. tritici]
MANTIVPNATLALSDSLSFKTDQQIKIVNSGNKPVRYRLQHLPAVSVKTFGADEKFNRPDVTPDTEGLVANAVMTPETFTLAPGSDQVVKIRFTAPKASSADLTVYSGYIILDGDVECESHNVPYYGVIGSLKDQEIIDRGPVPGSSTVRFPYVAFKSDELTPEGFPIYTAQKTNFIWKLSEKQSLYLLFRTVFGSPTLRIDVIAGDANPTPSKSTKGSHFDKSFGNTKIIGMVPGTEFTSLARSGLGDSYTTIWDATIVTGGIDQSPIPLPNGNYRLLIRALHVNGRKDVESDVDFWLSPPFTLVR